jgi:hypothetical protein
VCQAGETNPRTHQGLCDVCNWRGFGATEAANGVHWRCSAHSRLWSHGLSGEGSLLKPLSAILVNSDTLVFLFPSAQRAQYGSEVVNVMPLKYCDYIYTLLSFAQPGILV